MQSRSQQRGAQSSCGKKQCKLQLVQQLQQELQRQQVQRCQGAGSENAVCRQQCSLIRSVQLCSLAGRKKGSCAVAESGVLKQEPALQLEALGEAPPGDAEAVVQEVWLQRLCRQASSLGRFVQLCSFAG